MLLFGFIAFFLILFFPELAYAHTPHDEIELVRLSSAFWSDQTLFAVTRDNLLASYNAGLTWERKYKGLPYTRIRDLILSSSFPHDRCLVIATDNGIYHSSDAGNSWLKAKVHGDGFQNKEWFSDVHYRPAMRLAVSSSNVSPLMVGLINDYFVVSKDKGKTWTSSPVPLVYTESKAICIYSQKCYAIDYHGYILEFFPLMPSKISNSWLVKHGLKITTLTLLEEKGVLLIGTDCEGIWMLDIKEVGGTAQFMGLIGKRITDICILPSQTKNKNNRSSFIIYATEWDDGVYISQDASKDWSLIKNGLSKDNQADHDSFKVPHFKAITGLCSSTGESIVFVSGFDGLFQTNKTNHWIELENLITRNIIVGFSINSNSFHNSIAISLYGGGIHVVSDCLTKQPTYSSLRGVRSFAISYPPMMDKTYQEIWVAIHDRIIVLDEKTNSLRNLTLNNLHGRTSRKAIIRGNLVPLLKKILQFIPTWLRIKLRSILQNCASSLNLNIQNSVFGSTFVFSPSYTKDGIAYLSTWSNGLFRTNDSGKTYKQLWSPPDGSWIMSIAISPEFQVDHCLLLVTQNKLWISCDYGENWVEEKITKSNILRISIAELDNKQQMIFVSAWDGLYRIIMHRGKFIGQWETVLNINDGHGITDIAVAPDFTRSGIIIINKAGAGLFRSQDYGSTFSPTTIKNLTFDNDCSHMPGFPDAAPMIVFSDNFSIDSTIYAASGCQLFVSRDKGKDWQLLLSFIDENPLFV